MAELFIWWFTDHPPPIPTSELKIPLILVFKSPRYVTPMKIKEFITWLHSYEFIAKKTEQLSSDEENNIYSFRTHQRAKVK